MRIALLAVLLSGSAFATGERVVIASNNPLREALCISMTCVAQGAPHEATVQMHKTATGVEFVVLNAAGAVRLSQSTPLDDDGAVPSMDAARLVTLMVKAIEGPQPAQRKEAAKSGQAVAKKSPLKSSKLIARR